MAKLKLQVLNWYDMDKYTRGLIASMQHAGFLFITSRLGPKWADKLNPHDKIALSISNNPNKPHIIGIVEVVEVSKTTIGQLGESFFGMNVGAKTASGVVRAMRSAYPSGQIIDYGSVVSVIKLKTLPAEVTMPMLREMAETNILLL